MFSFFIHAFVSIFTILNPIGNIPLYLGFSENQDVKEMKQIALKAIMIALGILTTFLLLGQFLFSMFHISINSLRVIGGIIIFGIGYHLIRSKNIKSRYIQPKEQRNKSDATQTSLWSPAGSDTVETVKRLTLSQPNRWVHLGNICITFIAFCFVLTITVIGLFLAKWLQGQSTSTGLFVFTKLAGFLLTVIALEMVLTGLTDILPIIERKTA
ncbi:MarC family protein [Bacillus sp. JCM 19041]|uniref:MarC family protein n=1 Tax=Bacillus sp. JCM 19041 TaxID=1460637 RepID=UPI0006D2C113